MRINNALRSSQQRAVIHNREQTTHAAARCGAGRPPRPPGPPLAGRRSLRGTPRGRPRSAPPSRVGPPTTRRGRSRAARCSTRRRRRRHRRRPPATSWRLRRKRTIVKDSKIINLPRCSLGVARYLKSRCDTHRDT